jgi:hypothetical protein
MVAKLQEGWVDKKSDGWLSWKRIRGQVGADGWISNSGMGG